MTHKELSYEDLAIVPSDVYEQMGYREQWPDEATCRETDAILQEVRALLRPRLCFTVVYGTLDIEQNQLTIQDTTFDIGKIIARQLRGSEAFALFVATSGTEFEQYQQQLKTKGDMVRIFIADALGSVIAEKCADRMELLLQLSIDKLPIKSVSGIVGVGKNVRRLDYTCGLCDFKNCYKRRLKLAK